MQPVKSPVLTAKFKESSVDVLAVQALVDSNKDVSIRQLRAAGLDLDVGAGVLSQDTVVGRVVATGRQSFSIVFLPVTQEMADLMKARLEWYQKRYPEGSAKNYFRPDGTLPYNGWWLMKDYFWWNDVPEHYDGLR